MWMMNLMIWNHENRRSSLIYIESVSGSTINTWLLLCLIHTHSTLDDKACFHIQQNSLISFGKFAHFIPLCWCFIFFLFSIQLYLIQSQSFAKLYAIKNYYQNLCANESCKIENSRQQYWFRTFIVNCYRCSCHFNSLSPLSSSSTYF